MSLRSDKKPFVAGFSTLGIPVALYLGEAAR